MKKIILIAALFAATVSAKAQTPSITIVNATSPAVTLSFQIHAFSGTIPLPCSGRLTETTFISLPSGTYMGGPVSGNDPSWAWQGGLTPIASFFSIIVQDPNCFVGAPGTGVGTLCSLQPSISSFIDSCTGQTYTATWVEDASTPPNVTVTIN